MAGRDEPFAALGVLCTLLSLEDRAIKQIHRNYQILESVSLRLREPDEWACSSFGDEVCFYEGAFQADLRFPMPSLVREFLDYLNISPTQLASNAWRTIIGIMVIYSNSSRGEDSFSLFSYLVLYRSNVLLLVLPFFRRLLGLDVVVIPLYFSSLILAYLRIENIWKRHELPYCVCEFSNGLCCVFLSSFIVLFGWSPQ